MHFNTVKIRYNDDTFSTEFNQISDKMVAVSEVLETIFAEWNAGSGSECDAFTKARVRSLSVGDYVSVDGTWHRCEGIGWAEKSKADVAKWFTTLSEVRGKRPTTANLRDEIVARWHDRRKTEEILGIYS